ncbi:dephospho-CoA kinase [Candidatus Endobugula sertula]|uniref:Dephospho-CoA kinase n=1 Tax=Candidatus Endobugula sertula TaxID=62101 RepID=A0A1D2QP45_9GAMM|nr:dephospho-CoA kinase [Candidatus Endobugula sertula]
MTYILGLTGGIGSGKSAATDYFASLGIEIVDADKISREVVAQGSPTLQKIGQHFGQQMLTEDNTLNRALLREHIFANVEAKQWLENLLHPLIREIIIQRSKNIRSPYGILVSPLLFETQQDQLVDRTLVIDSSEKLQQQRAQQRDGVSKEQIEKMMASQLSRQERNQRADDVIKNNGGLEDFHRALGDYHRGILNKMKAEESG